MVHADKELVAMNVDLLHRRALAFACNAERDKGSEVVVPCNQTILDLISQAVNPLKLAQMDLSWIPNM